MSKDFSEALEKIKKISDEVLIDKINLEAENWIEDNLSENEWGVSFEPDDIDLETGNRLSIPDVFYPSAESKNSEFYDYLINDDFVESLLELSDSDSNINEFSKEELSTIVDYLFEKFSDKTYEIFEERIDNFFD